MTISFRLLILLRVKGYDCESGIALLKMRGSLKITSKAKTSH